MKSRTRLSDFTFTFHFHALEKEMALQCSCLENPRDGGAWWAAVCGVAQSQTWLKRLSSSRTKAGARTAPDVGHPQEDHVLLPQQRSCLKLSVVPTFALLPVWHPLSWLRCAWWRSRHSLSLSPGPQPKQAQPLWRVGRPQALMPPGFVASAKCKAPSRCLATGSFHQDKALSSREF